MKQETKERNKKLRERNKELMKLGIKGYKRLQQLMDEFYLSHSQVVHILYSKRYKKFEKK